MYCHSLTSSSSFNNPNSPPCKFISAQSRQQRWEASFFRPRRTHTLKWNCRLISQKFKPAAILPRLSVTLGEEGTQRGARKSRNNVRTACSRKSRECVLNEWERFRHCSTLYDSERGNVSVQGQKGPKKKRPCQKKLRRTNPYCLYTTIVTLYFKVDMFYAVWSINLHHIVFFS